MMRKNNIKYAEKIKFILLAAIILNCVLAVIHFQSYSRNIKSYKHHIVDMGMNSLRSLDGGRRAFMVSRMGGSERLKHFVEELSKQNSVLNMVIFDEEGNILVNPEPDFTPPFMGQINDFLIVEGNNTITIYSSFRNFNGPMRGGRGQMHHMRRDIPEPTQDEMLGMTAALVMDSSTVTTAARQMYFGLAQIIIIMGFLIAAYVLVLRFIRLHVEQIERLKKAEHEAEMGNMSQILAHEIRNPLSSISGLINFAEKKETSPAIKDVLQSATDELSRLNAIVNDFLSLGKEMKVDMAQVSLKELLNKTITLLQPDFNSKNICVEEQGTDTILSADRDKMLQVFFNLLLNALQASPEGGKIEISYDEKRILIKNDVTDNETDKAKLFEPFYTTKTKGSGLGLAVVKRICSLHGFSTEVLSVNPFIIEIRFGR